MSEQTPVPAVKKLKRLGWAEFLQQHEKLKKLHPSEWVIDWARLPRTLEKDAEGHPVFQKTRRTADPTCVVVYREGKLAARRYQSGYWETFSHGLAGQMVRYENSYGARVRKYWRLPFDVHPAEIHTGEHRWILIAEMGERSLYWCAYTGLYKDGSDVISREDLWEYFGHAQWGDQDNADAVYGKAHDMPASSLTRLLWRLTNHDPAAVEKALV